MDPAPRRPPALSEDPTPPGRAEGTPVSRRLRGFAVLLPAVAAAVWAFRHGPIPQDPGYHHFADRRTLLGIPHFGDVVTNLAFIIVGVWGLRFLRGVRPPPEGPFRSADERLPYLVFFASVLLTGLGSWVYHWSPGNAPLVWDRLPLTGVTMSLLGIAIDERTGGRLGRRLLPVFLAFGAGSVAWWHFTERAGMGDLRLYAMAQFYPLAAIPLLLLLFPRRYTHAGAFWAALGLYALAKACEQADAAIHAATGEIVSGHNLKHLLAAGAPGAVLWMLSRRKHGE
jgi:hypothetical protein